MTSPRSVRFNDRVRGLLARYVRDHPGTSTSSVTNQFVDEALRAEEHPGIVFRPGPTGRRAGLSGGPDVWEIIATLHTVRNSDPTLSGRALLAATAAALGVSEQKTQVAVQYYAENSAEIDQRIADNEAAVAQAEAAWRRQERFLHDMGPGDMDRAS